MPKQFSSNKAEIFLCINFANDLWAVQDINTMFSLVLNIMYVIQYITEGKDTRHIVCITKRVDCDAETVIAQTRGELRATSMSPQRDRCNHEIHSRNMYM